LIPRNQHLSSFIIINLLIYTNVSVSMLATNVMNNLLQKRANGALFLTA
jgi:hypothetical protein